MMKYIETPRDKGNRGFTYNSLVWRVLNSLAEKGLDKELNHLFEALVKNEYIDITTVLLGPLVKVHIVQNDLEAALQKFEWLVYA